MAKAIDKEALVTATGGVRPDAPQPKRVIDGRTQPELVHDSKWWHAK